MSLRDTALLDRWNETRDADAFSEIVSRHSGMVYGACMRILQDPAAAEDVSQECFIGLATGRTRIRTALGGWLHKAATHGSLNRLRAEKRRKEREKRFVQKSKSYTEPTWSDIQDHLDEAIAALPDKLRDPIVAHLFEGQTYDAIASETGAPSSTVASRVQRGISLIRKTLNRKGISASVTAVASALALGTAEAAPAPLTIALTKLAIAGTEALPSAAIASAGASIGAKSTAIGGIALMSKKIIVSVGVAILLFLGAYFVASRPEERGPTENQPAAAEVATSTEQPGEYGEQEDHAEVEPSTPALAQEQEKIGEEEVTAPPPVEPASVSGHVMDDEGYSVEGALIQLEVTQDPSRINVLKTYSARTSGDGTYAITGIETFGSDGGLYASADGYAMEVNWLRNPIAPGTDRKNINFILQRARHFVAGRVVTESGQSVPGATVQLRYYGYSEASIQRTAETGGTGGTIDDSKASSVTSGERGYFVIAIKREGLCDFTVTKTGYGPAFFASIPTGTEDALFVLLSSGAISGKVTRKDGSAVRGAQVEVTGHALPGGLEPSDVRIQAFRLPTIAGQADEFGRYEIGALGADYVYRVTASALGTNERVAKGEVRVWAGETTEDVDLVLGTQGWAVVYGKVTDASTRQPVHPLGVFASNLKADAKGTLGKMAKVETDKDGRYELRLGLTESASFRIFWRYMHSSGFGPLTEDSDVATLELEPNSEEELNFSIQEAPFSVVMLFGDKHGRPLPDVRAGIKYPKEGGGWGMQGSPMASEEDGRVTWEGLTAGQTYVALGRDQEVRWIGQSEPFTGEPAETVGDVVVVCAYPGGFEGVFTETDGRPISEVLVTCRAFQEDGILFPPRKEGRAVTNENGGFVFPYALPEGKYPWVLVTTVQPYEGSDEIYLAELSGLEIGADTIVDVGVLSGRPVSMAELARMLQ